MTEQTEQTEQIEQLTAMLESLEAEHLVAFHEVLEKKLVQKREEIEALASALGGSCSFGNGPARKKGKRSSTKHDDV